jgi:CheY-like chemotaxis protein
MPQGTAAPKLRILLVDEQATAVRGLAGVELDRLGHAIDRVGGGREALARARRDPPDLILLSATLPDVSGRDLIGALRQRPGLAQVPIVAICPGGDAELGQACLAAGAAACLSRPLAIDRLSRLIEQLLRPPREVTEPVLDLDHLRGFTEGDLQLEGELSALFLSTAEMYLDAMQEALEGGRPWTSTAHALKGASGNLGARRLSALALLAERSEPDRGQLDALARAVQELRALFAERVDRLRLDPAHANGPSTTETA